MNKYKYNSKYSEIPIITSGYINILRIFIQDFSNEREKLSEKELNECREIADSLLDGLIEIKCYIDTFNEGVLYAQCGKMKK